MAEPLRTVGLAQGDGFHLVSVVRPSRVFPACDWPLPSFLALISFVYIHPFVVND